MADHEAAKAILGLALLVHKEGGGLQAAGQEGNQPRGLRLRHVGQHAFYDGKGDTPTG